MVAIKKKKINMNISSWIVKILENNGVKHIFGQPGEQILPLYVALKDSNIEHILMNHEQAAAHASDAYSRSSNKFGVCLSTAGPGALNFTMAIATAFKDNVPMLIITGDNPTNIKDKDCFQSIPINDVFKNITFKSFNPSSSKEALDNLYLAINLLDNEPKGPIHINLSKDILLEELENYEKVDFKVNYNYENIEIAKKLIKDSKKPLIIAGAGVKYSKALEKLKIFCFDKNIPISTTYHAKGIINEFDKINLGMVGVRGSNFSNYALDNSDLIIALGCKLSERTIIDKLPINNKLIHVNIDESVLEGNCKIHGDVGTFLDKINDLTLKFNNDWMDEIYSNNVPLKVEGLDSLSLNPQIAIKEILSNYENTLFVNDAGTHTTWVTLESKLGEGSQLIYSGSFAPMGYGLPASIGASIANQDKKTVLINGDGGFQMNLQELAVISKLNLPIIICILNNNELGIIRQYEEEFYNMESYQVKLDNPDFIGISTSYGISSSKVKTEKELKIALKEAYNVNKPYLIEIIVESENIPFPK
ncbi:thiamine pyrophosphate-binding protein [Methanobrevibacter sp. DSM 116169]|uniref:thiamine pyrophosphate-binding protein n=1 Tax=Methanobrevibacter sp. DSM 116169 TaxID=3242727 RepID=UPI0038FC4EE4